VMASKTIKPVGRPTKYDPSFCEEVVKMGKLGKSLAQMAAKFDVARATIDLWVRDHPEFMEALNRAKVHCQAWWEDQGQIGMVSPGFNAPVWKKAVEARFRDDYTERQQVQHSGGIQVVISSDGAKQ
jgi:hypothetical protein